MRKNPGNKTSDGTSANHNQNQVQTIQEDLKPLVDDQETLASGREQVKPQSEMHESTKASGPRTIRGKRRSSQNSLKHGIFRTKDFLLPGESRAEYSALLKGLIDEYQPVGIVWSNYVEMLAATYWKMRRLVKAEHAEIVEQIDFSHLESDVAQQAEAWDKVRKGGISPGIMRPTRNPYVVNETKNMLKTLRNALETAGFESPGEDPWLLRKLFGIDDDGAAPFGFFKIYRLYGKQAAEALKVNDIAEVDRLKGIILESLDGTIASLGEYEKGLFALTAMQNGLKVDQALISPHGDSDRFLRYWKFLSRELNNILSQLERFQRMRDGQPVPPAIRIHVDT